MAVFLISSTTIQKPSTHLEQFKLTGMVKSVSKTSNRAMEDGSTIMLSNTISDFDKKGMLIDIKVFKDHKLFSKKTYTYSFDHHLLGYTDYNADGSTYLAVKYKYNEDGFLIAEHFDRSKQILYNQERQRVYEEYEIIYQNIYTHVTYKCDYKGFKTETKYLKPDGSLSHMFTFKYNYQYFLVERKYYNSNRKPERRTKYKYNEQGFIAESKTYISNRLSITSTFSYDYDNQGNWVKRQETRNVEENIFTTEIKKGSVITKRLISYY